ncbi:GNAT family N-acetyltransferase [Furfurilactobacillus siliginis]|nr:GNAT family N-acetyltransferase [Furfurilactobacillus siliginis]GEK29506.1 N-acetyltransferase GCN5 [Furfurilactobacillus siliginis]
MEDVTLRLATAADLDQVMVIIHAAQQFIARQGFDQWQDGYPAQTDMLADITAQQLYVLTLHGQVVAVAAAVRGIDPNYRLIEEGAWLQSHDYAAIHRVAVANDFRGEHLGQRLFERLFAKLSQDGVDAVRVDTHAGNVPMQHLLTRIGFDFCGFIYIDGTAKRRAYEHVLQPAH